MLLHLISPHYTKHIKIAIDKIVSNSWYLFKKWKKYSIPYAPFWIWRMICAILHTILSAWYAPYSTLFSLHGMCHTPRYSLCMVCAILHAILSVMVYYGNWLTLLTFCNSLTIYSSRALLLPFIPYWRIHCFDEVHYEE